jgi:iron complex outermembrane receptor protein
MKKSLFIALLSTLLLSDDTIDIEDDFLQSLEEVSKIATKTKLNIDDSPSFITVLHSNNLQKIGINNVFEALGQVPGVELKRERSGVPVVVFRGVSQKGEVKLMIDGVTINNTYRGSIYSFLDFPIELVDRIEVIRGAGSVLYGSGAISGVVNIITKNSNDENTDTVFISGGTYSNYKAGTQLSTTISDIKIDIDAYYQENSKNIDDTDRHLNDFSIGLRISNEHFGLLARIKESDIGNAYGALGVPDRSETKYKNENRNFFTEISYKNTLFKKSEISLLAGFNRYGQVIKDGYPKPTIDAVNADYVEHSYYTQADITSNYFQNNELLVGIKYENVQTKRSDWFADDKPITPISAPDLTRDIISIYANDKYSISNNFDLSAGLRYDNYSDFGDNFSPTVGVVYRANKKVRLKALYAHAFRAPSWIELTSNDTLDAETSDSLEAGIIYKQNINNALRFNIYHTRLDNMITKQKTYVQLDKATFNGAEFEYTYEANSKLNMNFLASYIDAKDKDGVDLADVANILASTSLVYDFDIGISCGSLLKYVSSSSRSQGDTRDEIDDSLIFDETISYQYKDFTATLIIKDLFDQGTYYALPQGSSYDFDDGGRSFLLKASMDF